MRLCFSALAFSLLHSVAFVSSRWETGLDGDLYGEIPRPTPEPLLYQDEFKDGAIPMETNLGYPRNETTIRNLAARQQTCGTGYVLACPTNPMPCCPKAAPLCCTSPASKVCCPKGSFCVGVATCCKNGQVVCTNPEGCCALGTLCCGASCCSKGYECISGTCVNTAKSSQSILSVLSKSSKSVASVRSKSINSEASEASVQEYKSTPPPSSDSPTTTTQTTNDSGNGDNKLALVGGAVGGAVGGTALVLIGVGVILWRRKKGASSAGQQSLVSQQPSSQSDRPTFPMNPSYISGPPITYATQPGWDPRQSTPVTMPGGTSSPATGHSSPASLPRTVTTWVDRPPTFYQEAYGAVPPQSRVSHSLDAEAPVDPRELYSNALQSSAYSATVPANVPSSAPGALPPPPPFPVSDKFGPWRA